MRAGAFRFSKGSSTCTRCPAHPLVHQQVSDLVGGGMWPLNPGKRNLTIISMDLLHHLEAMRTFCTRLPTNAVLQALAMSGKRHGETVGAMPCIQSFAAGLTLPM